MTLARQGIAARFWSKVAVGDSADCWPWRASVFSVTGYGCFGVAGKCAGAHRVAWELSRGESVPRGLNVLHSCDNRPCCNPAHLRVGTQAENMRDKVLRGRHVNGMVVHPEAQPRGEKHGNAKLTTEDVLSIRSQLLSGRKGKDVAAEFGIVPGTVSAIKVRRLWAHLTP